MKYEIGVGSNTKIIKLFNAIKSGSLELKPFFQRRLVWNNKHKEAFIDTILKGLPFPEIYTADGDLNLETHQEKTLVVDGQQRLRTIYEYITNSDELKLRDTPPFNELSDKHKTDFFDYIVTVRDLGRIDDETLKKIFKRINSVNYALNAMEVHNALYEGEYISTAKKILSNSSFKKVGILSETEYSRMRDVEFILLIMTTVEEGGYFSGGKELETYIKKFDDNYPFKEEMIKHITKGIELFLGLNMEPDSIWFRKTSFLNLIVEIIFFKKEYHTFPSKKNFKAVLSELEKKIIENRNEDIEQNEFAKYYHYTFSGTAGRKARSTRGVLIRKYLENLKK